MVIDAIGDLINRLTTAGTAEKELVVIPFSNLKLAVVELLKKEGFVGEISKKGKKVKKHLELELLYIDGRPRIKDAERVSRPSRRVYVSAKEIRPVKYGKGRLILSTPKGILTGEQARKQNVGGEALFKIW